MTAECVSLLPRPWVCLGARGRWGWQCECWEGGSEPTQDAACEAAAEHVHNAHGDAGCLP